MTNLKMKKVKMFTKEEIRKAREDLEDKTRNDFEKFRLATIEIAKKAHEIILD